MLFIRILNQEERKNTGTVPRQFRKPDIFSTTTTSYSSEQKAGLAQSSSAQSVDLPVHTDQPKGLVYVTRNQYASEVQEGLSTFSGE